MKLDINGQIVEVADADLTKAIEDKVESIAVKSDEFVIRSTEDETTFKANTRNEGIAAGTEIGRKNLIKAMGIEVDGAHKNDESATKALNDWSEGNISTALTNAKIEPNKQIDGFKADIATLKGTVVSLTGERDTARNDFSGFKKTQAIKSTLSGLIPENTIISKSDMLTLMGGQIKADIDENGNVFAVGTDGQPMKNKTTLEPLPMKEVITSFFETNPHYLKPTSGGAGGGDSKPGGGGKQTLEDFTTEMNEKGVQTNSGPFVTEMMKRQKEETLEA